MNKKVNQMEVIKLHQAGMVRIIPTKAMLNEFIKQVVSAYNPDMGKEELDSLYSNATTTELEFWTIMLHNTLNHTKVDAKKSRVSAASAKRDIAIKRIEASLRESLEELESLEVDEASTKRALDKEVGVRYPAQI